MSHEPIKVMAKENELSINRGWNVPGQERLLHQNPYKIQVYRDAITKLAPKKICLVLSDDSDGFYTVRAP